MSQELSLDEAKLLKGENEYEDRLENNPLARLLAGERVSEKNEKSSGLSLTRSEK